MEPRGAGRWGAEACRHQDATRWLCRLVFVSDWSFRSPGEMAEAAVLAWVRGPGTGCKALPWASARCSVRDVVYRHCQEQVRIVVETHQAGLGLVRLSFELF